MNPITIICDSPVGEWSGYRTDLEGEDLYAQVCARTTLEKAFIKVVNHPSRISPSDNALGFDFASPEELFAVLAGRLRTRTYRPAPVIRLCRLRHGKLNDCVRVLSARDRMVCWALYLVLAPILEREAEAIPGLSSVDAALRAGYYRVAPMGEDRDVLPQEELWALFRVVSRRIKDERIRGLIKLLLQATLTEEMDLADLPARPTTTGQLHSGWVAAALRKAHNKAEVMTCG